MNVDVFNASTYLDYSFTTLSFHQVTDFLVAFLNFVWYE